MKHRRSSSGNLSYQDVYMDGYFREIRGLSKATKKQNVLKMFVVEREREPMYNAAMRRHEGSTRSASKTQGLASAATTTGPRKVLGTTPENS